jgi:hypothetical protein
MRNLIVNVAAFSLAAALSACGSHQEPGAGTAAASQAHKQATQAANGLSPGMVAAVAPPGAGPGSVQVKFELQGHPDVAQPLDVDVVIVPVVGNVERISGKFSADDGLEVVSGQDIPVADKPLEGTPIHHSVKVLPKRDGIFTLTATLAVDATGRSTTETYSMPVIAGAGFPGASTQAVPRAAGEAGAARPAAAAQ